MTILKYIRFMLFASILAAGDPSLAHEFWLAPQRHQLTIDEALIAKLMVGRNMRGTELPYLTNNFQSFTITDNLGTRPITGFEGDLPALNAEIRTTGLHVIAYQSTTSEAVFETWDEFLFYLSYEGLDEIADQHRARGLPESGIKEHYSRFAKSLVQVGALREQDSDQVIGAPLELVAEQNPYTPGLESVDFQLLRQGAPVAGRQVALFRYDGEVRRHLFFTDDDGRINVTIQGGGSFLLNATDLQPVHPTDTGPVWESHWATLTFAIPVNLPEPHPLDPLNKLEIQQAMRAIGQSGHATKDTRVYLATLDEPEKNSVLAWRHGDPVERRAFAIVRNGSETFEAIVDLSDGKLISWVPKPGVQPAILSTEWARAEALVKADARWLQAMAERGYEGIAQIFCESLTAGSVDKPDWQSRRLLKMPCFDIEGTAGNIYGRPIEGLIAVVDLDRDEVLEVIDTGAVAISEDSHRLDVDDAVALGPARHLAPSQPNISLNQNEVKWGAWSFHVGFDQRFGPVLSLVTHLDGDRRRSVLYQGHLSEIFVPYMDDSEGWFFRAYMDAGEYGLGRLASPLMPAIDCPEDAHFLDGVLSTAIGAPRTRDRVICIFERPGPGPLWRHWEALDGSYHGRPSTELVVRTAPSVGNYDYLVDWVFSQAGEISIRVGATGIDAVKGVNITSMNDKGADKATSTGMLVAPNLVAVHHDHYFSFRLDLDVDGPTNSFRRAKVAPVQVAAPNGRKSLWRLEEIVMARESSLSPRQGPELWRFESGGERTALGHSPSYQIFVGSAATSLLSPEDWPQRRAAFSGETLWITSYHRNERSAGGSYPNQNNVSGGLPAFANDELIRNTDIVAWATLGFHHLTRPEDWPVLPTRWHEIRLRPFGFFERNSSLAVPEITRMH